MKERGEKTLFCTSPPSSPTQSWHLDFILQSARRSFARAIPGRQKVETEGADSLGAAWPRSDREGGNVGGVDTIGTHTKEQQGWGGGGGCGGEGSRIFSVASRHHHQEHRQHSHEHSHNARHGLLLSSKVLDEGDPLNGDHPISRFLPIAAIL